MKIIGIGLSFHHTCFESTTLESTRSLLDADLILVDPLPSVLKTLNNAGGNILWDTQVGAYRTTLHRRVNELIEFRNHARPLIYFPMATHQFVYRTADGYNKSGTQDDPIVSQPLPAQLGHAFEIVPNIPEALHKFTVEVIDYFTYRTVLDFDAGDPFLFIKGTKKAVGRYIWNDNEKVLLLPALRNINYSDQQEFVASVRRVVIGLDHRFKKYQLPDWHVKYLLAHENEAVANVAKLAEEQKQLTARQHDAAKTLAAIQFQKVAFLGNGQPLVDSVATLLADLGLKVQEGPEKRDDLIATFKHQPMVIEVKGRDTKGAAEKDATQLEKWVARYRDETGVTPRAMLVVNGYKDLQLALRIDEVFPNQMLEYSKKRDHCLISGLQLLCLHQSVKKGLTSADEAAQSLFNTIGIYPMFNGDEWKQFLSNEEGK